MTIFKHNLHSSLQQTFAYAFLFKYLYYMKLYLHNNFDEYI